jgi:hypothetical protein
MTVMASETTKIVTAEADSLTCCHWIPELSKYATVTTHTNALDASRLADRQFVN